MNKKFLLVDRINGIQKEATYILTFQNNNEEFLIYYLDVNSNNNKQIFVSKLIRNAEGKYFITDINPNEKNRINTIVYNIVIVLPTETNKNGNGNNVIDSFKNKFNINISLDPIIIESQNYLYNSRVAITSEILVNKCLDFYNIYLNNEQTKTTNNNKNILSQVQTNNDINNSQINSFDTINAQSSINPQMQILGNIENSVQVRSAISNDVILNNNINKEDNNRENNNEGFIINTSIIVGTIALLLSVLIVTFTFIVIKKMII